MVVAARIREASKVKCIEETKGMKRWEGWRMKRIKRRRGGEEEMGSC